MFPDEASLNQPGSAVIWEHLSLAAIGYDDWPQLLYQPIPRIFSIADLVHSFLNVRLNQNPRPLSSRVHRGTA